MCQKGKKGGRAGESKQEFDTPAALSNDEAEGEEGKGLQKPNPI